MKRILLALVLCMGFLPTPQVSAQAQSDAVTSMTSELTGQEIDLGDDGWIYLIPDQYVYNPAPPNREEYVSFMTYWSSFTIGFVQGPTGTIDYTEQTRDVMADEFDLFTIYAEETRSEEAWFLASVKASGFEYLVYYEYRAEYIDEIDFVFVQYAEAHALPDDFALVQRQVTIGGQPILQDIDPQWLESLIAETDGQASDDSDDKVETNSDIFGQLLGDPGPQASTSIDEEWAEKGIVSESEWVSPMYGTNIQWDTTSWHFPYDHPWAYFRVDDRNYDGITLMNNDQQSWTHIYIDVPGNQLTPQDYLDYWLSPEYAATYDSMYVLHTVTTANTVAILAETTDERGNNLLMVMTGTFLPNGEFIQTQLFAFPESVIGAYDHFYGSIAANGATLELAWTVQDVRALIGNGLTSGQTAQVFWCPVGARNGTF